MRNPPRSLFAVAFVALALALLKAACSSSSDEPASTPTPTSGPLLPIIVSEATSTQTVLDQLPGAEAQCLRDALGEVAFAALAQSSLDTNDQAEFLFQCLGDESLTRLLLGFFVGTFGGFSPTTTECLQGSLEGEDLRSILFGQGNGPNAGSLFIALFLCVNEQEARQLQGFFGEGGPTIDQMRCVAGQVDPSLLSQLYQLNALPGPERLEAMIGCGVDLSDGDGLDNEQAQCLLNALGAEALAPRVCEDYTPTPTEMEALVACGMDLGDREDGDGLDAEQVGCLLDALGAEVLSSLRFGDYMPTPAEMAALAACGADFEDHEGGEGLDAEQAQCLLDVLGAEVLAATGSEDYMPTPTEIAALTACGVNLAAHEGGDGPDADQADCLLEAQGVEVLAALGSEGYIPTPTEIAALTACGIDVGDHEGGDGPDSDQGQCVLDAIGAAAA